MSSEVTLGRVLNIGNGIREKDVQSHSGDESPRVKRGVGGWASIAFVLNRSKITMGLSLEVSEFRVVGKLRIQRAQRYGSSLHFCHRLYGG